MTHDANFTSEKIAKRIELIHPLVFRRKLPLPPFWLLPLDSATDEPPIDADPSTWERIPKNSYWGKPDLNFLMRLHFTVRLTRSASWHCTYRSGKRVISSRIQ